MRLVPTANLVFGLVTALFLAVSWAGVVTYKFISLKARAPLECANRQATENLKGVENALGTMSQQVAQASVFATAESKKTNTVLADLGKAFDPIEEALHESPVIVPAACSGAFPVRVRRALDQAVTEANR